MARTKRQSLRDKIREKANEKVQSRKGSNAISLPNSVSSLEVKKGISYFDIIPYIATTDKNPMVDKGDIWYERTFFRHTNVGSENKSIVCPLKTIKKPCPICEHRALLMKNYDDNKEQISNTRPSERQLLNVIDVDSKKQGIQILDMSHYCFGEMLETELLEDESSGVFSDLEGGMTLKIRFKEETIGKNTFLSASRIDFEDREDYSEDIMEQSIDLDTILNILSYNDIKSLFFELDIEEEPSASKRTRKTSKPEPEPELELELEEEKPKPSASKRTRKTTKPEEEKPKPSASKRTRKTAKPEPEEESTCPHGAVWGEDCDSKEMCVSCDVWDDCKDEEERLAK